MTSCRRSEPASRSASNAAIFGDCPGREDVRDAITVEVVFSQSLIRATAYVPSTESPPRAKKSSSTPTPDCSRTSPTIAHRAVSSRSAGG